MGILKLAQALELDRAVQPGTFSFPVLGFWVKNTMPYTGTMAYRRDFLS